MVERDGKHTARPMYTAAASTTNMYAGLLDCPASTRIAEPMRTGCAYRKKIRQRRGTIGPRKWDRMLLTRARGSEVLHSGLVLWSHARRAWQRRRFERSSSSIGGRASPVNIILFPKASNGLIHQKNVLFRMPPSCSGDWLAYGVASTEAFPR